MQIFQKRVWRYGHFSGFLRVFGHKVANIGLKIGLPINLHLNDEQNKNKAHILKVEAKIPTIWSKIDQVPLGHKDFKWA